MTREKYLRRIAILCLHCLRHMAYYRSGWNSNGKLILNSQFWVAANGNFIDMCVLEWCKLFGDKKGKHYWEKGISDPKAFYEGLLKKLRIEEIEFKDYIDEMRTYRDKYIAHLDLVEKFDVPRLDITKNSVIYLYDYLLKKEDAGGYFEDGPSDASQFYEDVLKDGLSVYKKYQ